MHGRLERARRSGAASRSGHEPRDRRVDLADHIGRRRDSRGDRLRRGRRVRSGAANGSTRRARSSYLPTSACASNLASLAAGGDSSASTCCAVARAGDLDNLRGGVFVLTPPSSPAVFVDGPASMLAADDGNSVSAPCGSCNAGSREHDDDGNNLLGASDVVSVCLLTSLVARPCHEPRWRPV